MVYDCAIVGTGPAGLAAALNLKIHGKSIIWVGSGEMSDKVSRAEQVSNYPGLPDIKGTELSRAFRSHAEQMGLEISDHMVNSVMPFGATFALMAGSEFYEAKTIILATGVAPAKLIEGESELLGRGVSYCATCDGSLYRGRRIAVVCTSARFEHEIRFLSQLASELLLFALYPAPGSFPENVTVVKDRVLSINGSSRVESISSAKNGLSAVEGVFILRDSIALSNLLPGLETENGHIKVDRSMSSSIPGVYAAGDCTGRPYQLAKAAGEGNIASHSVIEYLDK